MFKWLLPHDTNFFDLFEAHIEVVIESARVLLSITSENNSKNDHPQKIRELEHQADKIAHQCIEELHKTFITPFQRDDIHHLTSKMDDIIDYIEEVSCRFSIYRISEMTAEAKALAQILLQATEELGSALRKLRRLNNTSAMQQSFIRIHQLENQADEMYVNAIGKLFDTCEDARMIIKWKEIYERLEQAIDTCEDVANIIEGVILEST